MSGLVPRHGEETIDPLTHMNDLDVDFLHTTIKREDKGDHFLCKMNIPGFDKKEINISAEGNVLKVSAQHTEEESTHTKEYEKKQRRFHSFIRSFDICGIEKEKITARFENGTLALILPKTRREIERNTKNIPIT